MTPQDAPGAVDLLPDERIDEVNENLRLIQKKQGLTYGTDAYLLAAYVRPMPRARAVDLGSGTGIVPLLLTTKNKIAAAHAVEIQVVFSDLIARNAAINGLSERITPICTDLRQLNATTLGFEVDLVTANPPYMQTENGKRNLADEKYIARHEVHGGIEDFCKCAAKLLKHGGRFVSVFRPDRLSDLISSLRNCGLEPKRMTFVYADTESEPCMVLTEAVKGGAPSMRVTPPLILYLPQKKGETYRRLTQTANEIYQNCQFPRQFCN